MLPTIKKQHQHLLPIPKTPSTTTPSLQSIKLKRTLLHLRKHGQLWVVLLLGVLLMAGETTGLPMSSEYGGYQTSTPPPYCTTQSTYATSTYYTDAFKYFSSSYYKTEAPVYYTKATEYYTTTKC
ncbi:uncharacterized protein LOC124326647 [Daphnia pulicaria]|uniref:uncharacterized protein LOC124326647 n=1 Tax=Daphnia pulicaria TaxID=35523 RepID=UPI001EEA2A32|nr:uncharacterized protein LOC124326647 [Daphnia pulicaria]